MNIGICEKCGRNGFLSNVKFKLCESCNYKRLHNGKTYYEVSKDKAVKNHIKIKKATGELELFKEIWNEREHVCIHCKKHLPVFNPAFFAHIKPKSMYSELRLVKSNIMIHCFDCHFALDMQGSDTYKKRKDLHLTC